MNEEGARRLALVRAIETEDSAEALLTRDDRLSATGIALTEVGPEGDRRNAASREDRFLERRSFLALERLAARYPAVAQAERRARWPGWINWALPVAAFALGMASNIIDGSRMSIIAFPMLGMLIWNLTVYALIAAQALRKLTSRKCAPRARSAARLLDRITGASKGAAAAQQPLAGALLRYLKDWVSWSAPLTNARAARLFHVAAAALAIGLLAGMYWRALGTEYRAGWESTLLGPQAVHGLIHLMLWPASLLTGVALPDVARVASLRWGAGSLGENAAPWLHLYAATAVLFIIGPRLLLTAWNALRAARLAAHFPVPGTGDFYVRRLLRSLRGDAPVVRVIAYSFHPPEKTQRQLEALLGDVLGAKTRVTVEQPIAYGEEDEWLAKLDFVGGDADHLVVLFNLSATPEAENHGALVTGLRRRIAEAKSGAALTVLIDESAMRQRLGSEGAARLESRRAAWEAMLRQHHAAPLSLDLDAELASLARPLEAALLHAHAGTPA
ncbi:MAG TPA: DUF2868 domain-containing protein [Allosphingosinicella sp.]|jgi:hypothetical protein